jgi:predicted PurR-regulated permease PerM
MPSFLTTEESGQRQDRARKLYAAATLAFLGSTAYLLWSLRSMVLPVAIGMIMAYICLPLIGYLRARGFSRFWAIISLSVVFCLLLFSSLNLSGNIIPDKKTDLELRVRARYKLNEKFNALMGLPPVSTDGNMIYQLFGRELEPLREKIDAILALSPDEELLFARFFLETDEMKVDPVEQKYWQYFQANLKRDRNKASLAKKNPTTSRLTYQQGENSQASLLWLIFNAVSLWLVTPLVFLTLLFDDGRLKRALIHSVPNRYFEMTLTLIDNINEALGRYLRGTAIECFLVGTCLAFCLFLVGIDMRWAAAIGAIAGLANAIPFLGPLIGLIIGLLYAVMSEEINPILPFINDYNLLPAIVAAVALVQLLDNAIFQPYILGSAVDLHPLAVILGVIGGALLFGFAGMLLAIPVIMVIKVVVTTFFRQLRAYYLI